MSWHLRSKFWIGALGALLVGGVASGPLQADEPDEDAPAPKSETPVVFPAYPAAGRLVEFERGALSANRYFVDPASLSVQPGGEVRYTLVVRSSSGAENVSYEAIRCETQERRILATGHRDGSWSRSRNPHWVRISLDSRNPQWLALSQRFFCENGVAIRTPKEGLDALRRGGPVRYDAPVDSEY